jgi:hypothetical protein
MGAIADRNAGLKPNLDRGMELFVVEMSHSLPE